MVSMAVITSKRRPARKLSSRTSPVSHSMFSAGHVRRAKSTTWGSRSKATTRAANRDSRRAPHRRPQPVSSTRRPRQCSAPGTRQRASIMREYPDSRNRGSEGSARSPSSNSAGSSSRGSRRSTWRTASEHSSPVRRSSDRFRMSSTEQSHTERGVSRAGTGGPPAAAIASPIPEPSGRPGGRKSPRKRLQSGRCWPLRIQAHVSSAAGCEDLAAGTGVQASPSVEWWTTLLAPIEWWIPRS